MSRAVKMWAVAFGLLLIGFATTVISLNATVYSASGFVLSYLDALARQDSASALSTRGVLTANEADTSLLTDATMGGLTAATLVRDTPAGGGIHTIVFDVTVSGTPARSEFLVEQIGSRFGLFPIWRFVASPLTTASITVLHDDRLRVDGVNVTTRATPGSAGSFLVFSPGLYTLDHKSVFLEATPVVLNTTAIGQIADATVDVQANPEFVEKVQGDLATFLDDCATQQVLQPTGCPFARVFRNRIDTLPQWSIAAYPTITIEPGADTGTWWVPRAEGTATIEVAVRSLFDGTVSQINEDVPFSVEYTVEIENESRLVLTPVAAD
ncbi:MAG: hypothetical protein ACOH1J_04205 [Microbacteriaceae bacterium]